MTYPWSRQWRVCLAVGAFAGLERLLVANSRPEDPVGGLEVLIIFILSPTDTSRRRPGRSETIFISLT